MSEIKQIPLKKILPNPDQPRKIINEAKINILAESMKEVGQRTTALVRPLTPEEAARFPGFEYLLLGGHRRLEAAKRAGLETLRCEVLEPKPDEDDWAGLVDNESEPMFWLDKDIAIEKVYKAMPKPNQQKIAAQLGVTQVTISRALTLMDALNPASRGLIYTSCIKLGDDEEIPEGPIRALAALDNQELVEKALPMVLERQMTEPQVKGLVAHIQAGGDPETYKPGNKPTKPKPPKGGSGPGGGSGAGSPPEPAHPKSGPRLGVSGQGGGKSGPDGGKPAETITATTPDKPGEPGQKAKTGLLSAFKTWLLGLIAGLGPSIAKLAPKSGKEALKLIGRFLALPHHPCKYLANQVVPLHHSGSSHSHSQGGVNLLRLIRHWGFYFLLLPIGYSVALAMIGFMVGGLIPSSRHWFNAMSGYLFHLFIVQIPLGLLSQAMNNPETALALGLFVLWLFYELFKPKIGWLFFIAGVLFAAWWFRGWWMGQLHIALPSVQRSQTEEQGLTASNPSPQGIPEKGIGAPAASQPAQAAVASATSAHPAVGAPAKRPVPKRVLSLEAQMKALGMPVELNGRTNKASDYVAQFAVSFYGITYHGLRDWADCMDSQISGDYRHDFFEEYDSDNWLKELGSQKEYETFEPSRPPELIRWDDTTDDWRVVGTVTLRSDLAYDGKFISKKRVTLDVSLYHDRDGSEAVYMVKETAK